MQFCMMSSENLSFIHDLNIPPQNEIPLPYACTDRNTKSYHNVTQVCDHGTPLKKMCFYTRSMIRFCWKICENFAFTSSVY